MYIGGIYGRMDAPSSFSSSSPSLFSPQNQPHPNAYHPKHETPQPPSRVSTSPNPTNLNSTPSFDIVTPPGRLRRVHCSHTNRSRPRAAVARVGSSSVVSFDRRMISYVGCLFLIEEERNTLEVCVPVCDIEYLHTAESAKVDSMETPRVCARNNGDKLNAGSRVLPKGYDASGDRSDFDRGLGCWKERWCG
ncbi:hypothetical protein EJ05DRAFT_481643 [Pseudovirgaria hyperparasitica]|uniref:Uncharacterized protein n=1 Tax=Pseudovirgaria hyperparasitica TaxID=470096 RepID=A0A6A6WKM9_9PEZI|nr:uncharacterized protein EJ05DRAFT_481643 [Pseudovirgaria hyperparasitica]KAF2762754.1 hypothetical protein EJ05DRAFT_481643 [Pseudovirgaria hyperparasitica]